MDVPQKLVAKIVRDYAATKSIPKTVKRVGLSSRVVQQVLIDNGVERVGLLLYRQRIRKLPERTILLVDYDSGLSENAIAEKYGCHRTSVHQALKKAGAKMRPRGNWEKVVVDDEAWEIAAQYRELGSLAAVAAIRNTSQPRVKRALHKLGIPLREMLRESHPSWKGGRGPAPGGYICVFLTFDDPLRCMGGKTGRVMEHRLVMARALGRPLSDDESVHHINGDKTDNRMSNLQLRFGKHGKGVVMVCAQCGSHEIKYKELD